MKFNLFGVMNSLVRQDIWDLLKVNVPSWLTVGWVQSQTVELNSIVQETGTSLLIIATLLYTIFKAVDMFRHMRWAKEDRTEEEVLDD